MITDSQINNIGKVIEEGLKNPVVRCLCMQGNNSSVEELKQEQDDFSRFIGFCILFRGIDGIQDYMLLNDRDAQIAFLIHKISEKLGIPKEDIKLRRDDILYYAYKNFKEDGYVFHAANSESVQLNMTKGLNDNNVDRKQQEELLYIESIYRKYDPDNQYSPLGHAAEDIKELKTGWFFDGLPIHSTIYANSPQWMSYLCGKSYVYYDSIPKRLRSGYANRDYDTSFKAISWLIEDRHMSSEDGNEMIDFFMKCWKKYKDTTPCLMFIPVAEVGINDDIGIEQYVSKEGAGILFGDIIDCRVNPIKNGCCKKRISPDKLSFVDLSPILPRFKINKKNTKMVCEEER